MTRETENQGGRRGQPWRTVLALLAPVPTLVLGVVNAEEPQTLQRSPAQRAAIRAFSDVLDNIMIATRPSFFTDPTDTVVRIELLRSSPGAGNGRLRNTES